jgi:hypothetical protein
LAEVTQVKRADSKTANDFSSVLQYDPGPDGSIRWAINGSSTWTVHSSAIGPDAAAGIGQRLISPEPMSIVLNLAISFAFQVRFLTFWA